MDFGLGLVLSFTDNATSGINNTVNSLNQLTQTAENASSSLNQMASLSALSVISDQMGSAFLKAGGSILSVFQNLFGKVQSTGSEFESFRITLNALYGDANKAENAISRLLDFSVESPFEVDEVKDMLVVLQSQGIDAFSDIAGSITNTRKETLSWISDIMAFKPDEATSRWKRALTNYIGSAQPMMLRNILDMGEISEVLGHDIGSTVEERMNDIVEIVEKKGLTNLAEKLTTTWEGVSSNVSDAFTKLYKSIADNGVFEKLKTSLLSVSGAILSLDDKQIEAFGKTMAEGLNLILTPISYITDKLNGLIISIVELCQTHPEIVKWSLILGAITGALLTFVGVILKVTSAMSGLSLMLLVSKQSFKDIGSIMRTGFLKILSTLLPLAVTIGLFALAWKSDFAGIRTNTINFVNGVVSSFKTARQSVNGSVEGLRKTISNLNNKNDFFSNLTLGIMKVMMAFKALVDAWGDYTLSEDNFLKAKELGILPLIEAILDLKYRFEFFKKGFVEGWKEVSDKVSGFILGIASSLEGTMFEGLLDGVTKFLQKLGDNDPKAWEDFGKIVGELSANFMLAFVALKMFDSVASKVIGIVAVFSKLSGLVTTLFSGIGSKISSVITKIFPTLHKIVEKGLQTVFGSNIQGIIPNIKIWFAGVKDVLIGAVTGIASALGAPVWVVVAIIIAILSSIISYAVTNWEEFKGKIVSIWENLKEEATDIWESIKSGLERIWENLKSAISPVVDAFNDLKSKFKEFIDVLGENEIIQAFIGYLSSIGETLINILVPAINMVVDIVSSALQGIWNIIVTVFNSVVNIISSVLSSVMNIIGGILDIIVGIFTLDLDKIWQGVSSIFLSILDIIITILSSAWNIVMSILTTIANVFGDILTGIVDIVIGAFSGIVEFIGSYLDLAFSVVSSVWETIKSTIDTVLENISSGISSKWEFIKNTISDAINGARDTVEKAIEKIKGFFDFDWSLPKLKLPHLTITGGFSIAPPSVPKFSVDWYEKGGVFDNPSVIGVGENGQEAVMPLENNTGWISVLAGMITTQMSNMRPVNTNNQTNTTNQGDTNTRYLTNNSTTNQTIHGDTDNSVVFNQGAIQLNVQNATEEEAIRMARKIMEYINRQRQLDSMMTYA